MHARPSFRLENTEIRLMGLGAWSVYRTLLILSSFKLETLKGLTHEIDFKNVNENGQIFALIRAAVGF